MPQGIIGRKIFYFKKISSTNDYCLNLALKNEEEGIVVIADEQTKGRGRFKRRWLSPKGDGLYFSILLNPKVKNNLSLLSLASGLAVANALNILFKINALIKWPNDITINYKKICGILIEKKREYLVVGIGINVNNKIASFPSEIRNKATSIFIETRVRASKKILLNKTLDELNKIYNDFLAQKQSILVKMIKQKCDALGKHVNIIDGTNRYEGEVLDIAGDGALIIRSCNDKIIKIHSGEIIDGYSRG